MSPFALTAELRRAARLTRSYWLEYLADFGLYTLGFLLLIAVFRTASPDYGPSGYLSTLIGYISWKICASVMVDLARMGTDEARAGTLEQIFLTKDSPGSIFIGRGLGSLLNHGLRGFTLGALLAAILGILQPVTLLEVVLFLLTLAGAFGLGIGLAGLVLVFKRLGGILQLLWQMLVFFTGALVPLPGAFFGVISRLLPLTWGIIALRSVMIDGAGLSGLWQDGTLTGLVVNTLFYVLLGAILFAWGSRRARELGVLGHY